MWLDTSVESKWKDFASYDSYPSIMVVNPGKRKRFTKLENDVTPDNISKFFKFRNPT